MPCRRIHALEAQVATVAAQLRQLRMAKAGLSKGCCTATPAALFSKLIIVSLLVGILTPGSIKIERGMKKYFWGLILRVFGLMGSSLVPGEGPR